MKMGPGGSLQQTEEGEKKVLNSELWHACAGPLVSLPHVGSHVVYFPQGHSEQVAASTNKEVDSHIPNYPNLPPQLICQLHDVTMHADVETDEVYAQMTLQPLTPQEQKDVCVLPTGLGTQGKQPTNYFCKTLTASDTSTHGGFSVPRRAAEKVFPPLDYNQQPPCQELIARDLHDNEWKFRHIFRGQPKRHLLTTGWSVFVSAKRLVAGDSVIFIWNEKNELFLGIRRANRSQTVMPSSVLSSDSMHIGLLAAAAHAAATNSRFTIFFNPRASPSEFVVPLPKFVKAVYQTRVSVGMRFRMLFETEESSVRRYMGTITSISDLNPVRWPNSHWRSVKVGWDESTAGERQPRVSLWEIEPLTTFPMYPSPFSLRLKRPWSSALPSFPVMKNDDLGINSPLMWLQRDTGDCYIPSLNFQGYGLMPGMQPKMDPSMLGLHPDIFQTMTSPLFSDQRSEKRPNHSFLQFQHHNPNMQNHLLQQAQQTLAQNFPENQTLAQNPTQNQNPAQNEAQNQLLQQQLRTELLHYEQQRLQYSDQQSAISSTCPQQFFSNSVSQTDLYSMHSSLNSFSQVGGTRQYTIPESNPQVSSSLPSKRDAVEPQMCGGTVQCSLAQVEEELGAPQTRGSELSQLLPPLPTCSREFSVFHDIGGPQSNGLFGVGNGNENDSLPVPFSGSSFQSVTGDGFQPGSDMSSTCCVDDSGYLQSLENMDQLNQPNRTFVKVHKMGSFGRSLDISQFSSYQELRSELARMFGLENELEDSMRSGWQLVFVDREDDILLVGDDPWQEFVKTVGYIRILTPQEVQQMGKQALNIIPTSDSNPKLQNSVNICNDRNMTTSLTTLDY